MNWREVFWNFADLSSENGREETFKLIKNFLNYAHILKLAKEEASFFFKNDNPEKISELLLNRPDVIITDGPQPVKWFINGLQGKTKTPSSLKIIDTTGAGDAFLAGLISKLVSDGYPSNKSEIIESIRFASACGFLTCLGEGAIEQQPDYLRVKEFLGS